MRIYIIGSDGITLCRDAPATISEGEVAVTSNEELHTAPLSGKRLLEECHNADARFRSASTLTLRTGLQALGYTLWDSDLERLVPFRFAAAG
jgi:hypothetical protein